MKQVILGSILISFSAPVFMQNQAEADLFAGNFQSNFSKNNSIKAPSTPGLYAQAVKNTASSVKQNYWGPPLPGVKFGLQALVRSMSVLNSLILPGAMEYLTQKEMAVLKRPSAGEEVGLFDVWGAKLTSEEQNKVLNKCAKSMAVDCASMTVNSLSNHGTRLIQNQLMSNVQTGAALDFNRSLPLELACTTIPLFNCAHSVQSFAKNATFMGQIINHPNAGKFSKCVFTTMLTLSCISSLGQAFKHSYDFTSWLGFFWNKKRFLQSNLRSYLRQLEKQRLELYQLPMSVGRQQGLMVLSQNIEQYKAILQKLQNQK